MGKKLKTLFGLGVAAGAIYLGSHLSRDGKDYGSIYENFRKPLNTITSRLKLGDITGRYDLIDKVESNMEYRIKRDLAPVGDSYRETKNDLKSAVNGNIQGVKETARDFGPLALYGLGGLFGAGFLYGVATGKKK